MTRLMKEINRCASRGSFDLLYYFGVIEFSISSKHLTGRFGKIVHHKLAVA